MNGVLFCNIGWMDQYRGMVSKNDIKRGGRFVKEKGRGHEVCNFLPVDNQLYGYVRAPGNTLNLERIGIAKGSDFLEDITVVWLAGPPKGGTVVIGWYRGATVYRRYQEFETVPPVHRKNQVTGYWISAPAAKAVLLPKDARKHKIYRGEKGSLGQSNIWYGDSKESFDEVQEILAFIENYESRGKRGGRNKQKPDSKKIRRVEQIAIENLPKFL